MERDKMYYLRKVTGLSQAAFASKYNIPKRTIEDWESSRRKYPQYVYTLLEHKVFCDIQREVNTVTAQQLIDDYLSSLPPGDTEFTKENIYDAITR